MRARLLIVHCVASECYIAVRVLAATRMRWRFYHMNALIFVRRFIDAKSRPSLVEKIFLTVGMLCFIAMGNHFPDKYCPDISKN